MSLGHSIPPRIWRAWAPAVALALGAGLVWLTPDIVYPPRSPEVYVRWAPSVSDASRADLESSHRLTRGRYRENRTWAYYLGDTGRSNVRALVTHPAVEDTHFINRDRFRVWRNAPREAYSGRWAETLPGLTRRAASLLIALAALAAVAALRPRWVSRVRAVAAPVITVRLDAAHDLIPAGSARSVAAFRVVLGLLLFAWVAWQPVNAALAQVVLTTTEPWTHFSLVWRALEARPWLADSLQTSLLGLLAAFTVGLVSRAAFVLACGGLTLWVLLHASRSGAHPYGAFVVALWCLAVSPWGDAWSLDAALRRRLGRPPRRRHAREYGYVTWMPGVVLGVCFFAAAFAKLRESGLAWVTNGTVKYHFLSDSPRALVDWGAQFGRFPALAVVASAAAILIEGTVIGGALSGHYGRRVAAGAMSVSMLLGFLLLQGLFWPGWWLLLLSFLPWHLLRDPLGAPSVEGMAPMRRAQALLVLLLFAQQLVVSTVKAEVFPVLSYYDMYSSTNASPDEYEGDAGESYYLVARAAGADANGPGCEVPRAVAQSWVSGQGTTDPMALRAARTCFDATQVPRFVVEGRRMRVDWTRWRFEGQDRRVLTGPLEWTPDERVPNASPAR